MCDTKVCKQCGIEKSFDMFHKHKQTKDRLFAECKDCRSAHRKAKYQANRDRELTVNRAWKAENKERLAETNKRWKLENKEYYAAQQKAYSDNRRDLNSAYAKQWYLENKDRKLHLGRLWYLDNKEYKDAQNRQWRKENPEKVRQLTKLYRMVNVDKFKVYSAKYRAKKLQATPFWLNDVQIEDVLDFYTAARMFQLYTGNEYHVDHIVPLQGETVCGLHVPWNLQLLPWNENISKGNRYWPDMPEPE
jgi:hypothetical protein